MSTYITSEIFNELEKKLMLAKKSLLIISPYVTKNAAKRIIELVKNRNINKDCRLVTLPPGNEYIKGATDPEALFMLQKEGFKIRVLNNLHAKIYVIDEEVILLGSANFTSKGLGLIQEPNRELMIIDRLTSDELEAIENEFWNDSMKFDFDESTQKKIKEICEKYSEIKEKIYNLKDVFSEVFNIPQNPYEELLFKLKSQNIISNFSCIEKGMGKHAYIINDKNRVKIFRSQNHLKIQKYEEYFNYKIHSKSANNINARKVRAVIFMLEEPDRFICLPTTFVIENIIKKQNNKNKKYWHFQIVRTNEGIQLNVRTTKRKLSYEVSKYEGKMNYKFYK